MPPLGSLYLIAMPRRSPVLLVVATAMVTASMLLFLELFATGCVLMWCFEGLSAADGVARSSGIGGSSDASHLLLDPAGALQSSALSGVLHIGDGGCRCSGSNGRHGGSGDASGSIGCGGSSSGYAMAVAAEGGKGGGERGSAARALPAVTGPGVTVADPSASDDVDLHQMYRSLSRVARWMRDNNKDFPALTPPPPPSQDSSVARGGATTGGGLDAVQLVTASMRSACRATSAPGMQLKGRKFLMLAQTWEQLSQTRLHLIEAMALAKMLNRTLVLTQVGSGGMGDCVCACVRACVCDSVYVRARERRIERDKKIVWYPHCGCMLV